MATSYYDDVVMIELDKINQLYEKYQKTTNDLFASEMIESFLRIMDTNKECILESGLIEFEEIDINKVIESFHKIIKTQRELICYLNQEPIQEIGDDCDYDEDDLYPDSNLFSGGEKSFGHNFIPYRPIPQTPSTDNTDTAKKGFHNDKQLQAAFTSYCLENGKSSYTANDYCSRIKNLWKNFYNEYKEGKLEDDLKPKEEMIDPDSPLLSVFHHTELLSRYIMMKIDETDGNRNWTNTRAAFNKFDKFRCSIAK